MPRSTPDAYDVLVVGAGPAGSSAARVAAQGGLSVCLLDRSPFPRYKTCGGGLIGPTIANLRNVESLPIRDQILCASFTLDGGSLRERAADRPLITTVSRTEMDHWLVRQAADSGVEFRNPCTVKSVVEDADGVTVETDAGAIRARIVIGADGTAGRVSRYVGVELRRIDLGLEIELGSENIAAEWKSRMHLDWGADPGSYAWVFPKGDSLTVGVIAAKGRPQETRRYLKRFVRQMDLESQRVLHESGHTTRVRTVDSPLVRGRVLVVGDAAGLIEPWTREGISFAVRSGSAAGESAVAWLGTRLEDLAHDYVRRLGEEVLPEMRAGEACLRAFERQPKMFHGLISRTSPGWTQFARVTRGETTLARAHRHPVVRGLLAATERMPRREVAR